MKKQTLLKAVEIDNKINRLIEERNKFKKGFDILTELLIEDSELKDLCELVSERIEKLDSKIIRLRVEFRGL